MSIEVRCDACGESHRVNARMAGRSIRCRGCDASVTVPQPPQTSRDTAADFKGRGVRANGTVPEAGAGRADDPNGAGPSGAGPSGPGHHGVSDHDATGDAATAATAATSNRVAPHRDDDSGGGGHTETETVLFHDAEDDVPLRREKRPEEELDMTPMVDVTFLLLIFFMVTASFSLQKSIQVPRQTTDLPSASPVEEETEELDPVELEIDEFGGFYVITADFEEETPGKQNLIRTLKRVVNQTGEAMQLKIRVHELAKLQALVDGMDAGTIAGFTEIEVSQVENF